jgi:multidrug resistance protein, MATE family
MTSLDKTTAFKQLFFFSLPIIFGHVGLMLIGTGDMIIAGRYSKELVAAIGLALAIANPIIMIGLGLQFALSPILAQKRGQGEDIHPYFWSVIAYSVLVGLGVCVFTLASVELVPLLGYEPGMTLLIQDYLWITSFSAFGMCLYQGIKEFLQAQEKTIIANLIAFAGVGVNLYLNYSFVFGRLGMPELREAGLAWASLGVRFFMGACLFLMVAKVWRSPFKLSMPFLRESFKLGVPITFALFLEVMAFCSVTLFVGRFVQDQVAANNLALNIGSLAFMIPMSIAAAVGVKVGHAYGEGNINHVKIFVKVSLLTSFCATLMMALVFYTFPDLVMSVYTSDVGVLEWGKRLLFWVACFQIFDGAQVTLAGILRGLSISRSPSVAIFIGYWVIGIPLGVFLGYYAGLEAQGFWIGLALSLALVAVMLSFILKHKLKQLVPAVKIQ